MSIYDELTTVLSVEIGESRARSVCDRLRTAYGGQRLYFPKYSRPSTNQTAYLTIGQIKKRWGVGTTTAYKYKK